ncbi:MAG: hypothetical protein GX466_02565 [Candidatus Cloacimonetes bacterium]|jgi:hypothetical protein|nr:hypothetical protein [Candidatus Cloacimonadota bacterium]
MADNTAEGILKMHEKYKAQSDDMIQSLEDIIQSFEELVAYQDEQIKILQKVVDLQQEQIDLLMTIENSSLETN